MRALGGFLDIRDVANNDVNRDRPRERGLEQHEHVMHRGAAQAARRLPGFGLAASGEQMRNECGDVRFVQGYEPLLNRDAGRC
jgi:hypothetical protein